MSYVTLEVEIDHGRIIPKGTDLLPEKANALLTILPDEAARIIAFNRLTPNPNLPPILFFEDPSLPLDPEDWPEAFE